LIQRRLPNNYENPTSQGAAFARKANVKNQRSFRSRWFSFKACVCTDSRRYK
jgi:hypothetical protein